MGTTKSVQSVKKVHTIITIRLQEESRKYPSNSSGTMELSSYRDQHFKGTRNEQEKLLRQSTTLYIGNLSYYTTEEQLYELFSKCGDVKRVVMGLDKFKRTPCGFCFVEYYTRQDTEAAQAYINGKSGGQVRDEYRTDYDAGRGGYGMIMKQKLEIPDFIK